MKPVHAHDILRDRLLIAAKLKDPPAVRHLTLADLESQWSPEFELYMRNRLMMGALRYGGLNPNRKQNYDAITSAIKRLCLYNETGNLECLVDAANLCLVEYVCGHHPKRHFHSFDSDGTHAVPI